MGCAIAAANSRVSQYEVSITGIYNSQKEFRIATACDLDQSISVRRLFRDRLAESQWVSLTDLLCQVKMMCCYCCYCSLRISNSNYHQRREAERTCNRRATISHGVQRCCRRAMFENDAQLRETFVKIFQCR
jgi:hypothetical protein